MLEANENGLTFICDDCGKDEKVRNFHFETAWLELQKIGWKKLLEKDIDMYMYACPKCELKPLPEEEVTD